MASKNLKINPNIDKNKNPRFKDKETEDFYEEHKKKFKEISEAYETLSDSQKKKLMTYEKATKITIIQVLTIQKAMMALV